MGARPSQHSGTKKASGAKVICKNRRKNVLGHYTYLHVEHTKRISSTLRLQCITYTELETGDVMWPKSVTDMQ